jgi:hypothetical protein
MKPKLYKYGGREWTLKEMAQHIGMKPNAVHKRLRYWGGDVERVMRTPYFGRACKQSCIRYIVWDAYAGLWGVLVKRKWHGRYSHLIGAQAKLNALKEQGVVK